MDDGDNEANIPVNVTVLGRNSNSVIQANIDEGTTTTYSNLTESLGVPFNGRLMALNNYESLFGYHFPNLVDNGYTVWEKNIDTDVGTIYNGFCNETSIETPYFPQVANDYITVFTAELISTGNRMLNLRIFNKDLDLCSKTSIGIADQFQQLSRLMVEDKILTYHFNSLGQAIITKIDLITGAIEGQLTFESGGAATVMESKLYFYPSSGESSQVTYDFATFQLIETITFPIDPFLGTGLFKAQYLDNSILIDRNYVQPAMFSTFPALLDQDTGDILRLTDLGFINSNLISFLDSDLAIETSQTYTVDLDNFILVGSFILFNFDLTIIEYGIYYAKFDGTILGAVPIDFRADKVIIR